MFCSSCGRRANEGELFCPNCGARIPWWPDSAAARTRNPPVTPSHGTASPRRPPYPYGARAVPSTISGQKHRHRRAGWVTLLILFIGVVVFVFGAKLPELLFILAVSPSAFLLWFFYHADKYKHESPRLLSVTFALGALAIIPAVIIERLLGYLIPQGPGLVTVFVYFVIGVALVEESFKFLAVRIYAYRSPLFDEPMDGIVLGVAAALGFATVENLLYVFQYGIVGAVIRAFVSVPGHAFYGAVLGFYLGEAKFRGRPGIALKGLPIAILLHGAFDTIARVSSNLVGLVVLVAFVWIIYSRVVRKEIKEAEAQSPYRQYP